MLFAGVDVGAATAKTVILAVGEILGYAIIPTGHNVRTAAERVTKEAMSRAGVSKSLDELEYIISTGYGRKAVYFANNFMTQNYRKFWLKSAFNFVKFSVANATGRDFHQDFS